MKRKILLVDDEPSVLQGLKRMLRSEMGLWDLSFATSADEAWALLSTENFDTAVLDVKMPGKGGLELLSDIKSDPHTSDVETIVLTGLEDQDLKRRALDLGAADLLSKPVLKEDFIARINNALRTKSYRDELQNQNVELERQLLQSQKMEIIGMLAAGVAHDLNNMLSAIMLNTDLTSLLLTEDSEAKQSLNRVNIAGERAKKIVGQISKFSKRTKPSNQQCDLGSVINECIELLRSSLSKNVKIEWDDPEINCIIGVDETQIYQVLMNLGINAGHAMKDGGVLTFSLMKTELSPNSIPDDEVLDPGPFWKLEVSDTGDGMDQTTLRRIFEPLFTTKESSGGTGIGLAVVHRIVKGHGGFITVESEEGAGTIFSVYLPYISEREITGETETKGEV